MPSDPAQSAQHVAGDAAPPPRLRLVRKLYAFLLAFATAFVLYVGNLASPQHGARSADYPLSPIGRALLLLFVAYFLLWIAYSVWRNRRSFRAWGWVRRIVCSLRIVLQPVFWLILAGLLVSIIIPAGCDYTVRAKMSELLLSASSVRTAVTERARKNGTLTGSGAGLDVSPSPSSSPPPYRWVTTGLVGRDGVVVVYSAQLGLLAVLLPEFELRRDWVTWSCQGMPPQDSPSTCKEVTRESNYATRFAGSAREDALALLARAAAWQRQVESSAPARGTLEGSVATTVVWRQGLTDFALLDSNGRMALYSDRHGTFALLEPKLESGKVTWRCRVWPAAAAIPGCRAAPDTD